MEIFKQIDVLILENIGFQKLNFSHLDYMKDYNTGIFYKETSDKIDALSYGFGYDYRNYDPIIMNQDSFASWITFKNVEKILDYCLYNQTNPKQFENSNEFYLNIKKTILNTEVLDIKENIFYSVFYKDKKLLIDNIFKCTEQAQIFINEYHLSYFNRFSTIQDVNDKILEKYDWMDWSDYFFKDAHFKAIIIMKLCNNNKKYDEFTAMYKSRIFDAIQDGSNDLIPFYENLLKVMNYLDSGEYKNLL